MSKKSTAYRIHLWEDGTWDSHGGGHNFAVPEHEWEAIQRERKELREVIRDCARTLQHNLSMHALKDERMMLNSLERAWKTVGRGYCERAEKRRKGGR